VVQDSWSVTSPFLRTQDTFAEEIAAEGFALTEDMKEKEHTPTVNRVIAEQDVELVKQMNLPTDDRSIATKDGISVLSDATHTTHGNASIRTQNTQSFNRNLEERCIAQALEMERAAAAKWKDYAAAATSGNGLCSDEKIAELAQEMDPPNNSPSTHNQSNSQSNSSPNSSSDTPSTDNTAPTNQVSPDSHSSPNHSHSSIPPPGEPASTKQSGLGNNSSSPSMDEAAEGPRGAK
jgi:hypothetical protein